MSDYVPSCSLCRGKYWVYPVPTPATIGQPLLAMRCSCIGGPEALASSLERQYDRELAHRVRQTFKNITPQAFQMGTVNTTKDQDDRFSKVRTHADMTSEKEFELW